MAFNKNKCFHLVFSANLSRFSGMSLCIYLCYDSNRSTSVLWQDLVFILMSYLDVVKAKIAQCCQTLWDSMDCSLPGYFIHGILEAWILEGVAIPFSRGSSQPRDQTQVSHIIGRFSTIWVTRKSKNTGVGCLSHLQWIFQTQELNRGLLHCRWVLYQLSYQGSPIRCNLYFFSRNSKSYKRNHLPTEYLNFPDVLVQNTFEI